MDLHRHLQVLWRFRRIVLAGLLLGIIVATLTTFKVSFDGGPHLTDRKAKVWTSNSRLLVTQEGFPWGRTVLPGNLPNNLGVEEPAAAQEDLPAFADPSRLGYLSVLYSNFLMGDEIRTMLRDVPGGLSIVAAPLRDGTASSAAALPIIELSTSATTPAGAIALNAEASSALRRYLVQEQRRSATPAEQRVEIATVVDARGAVLTESRSLTMPLVAFLFSLLAAVAFAYILENLRMRRALDQFAEDYQPDDLLASADIGHLERTSS